MRPPWLRGLAEKNVERLWDFGQQIIKLAVCWPADLQHGYWQDGAFNGRSGLALLFY